MGPKGAREAFTVHVAAKRIDLFGIEFSETVITSFAVTLALILIAVVIRIFVLPRFKDKPGKFQNVIEIIVDGINGFANTTAGEYGSKIASYGFTLGLFLVVSGLLELFSIRAPGTDLNFTIAISAVSFLLINAFGLIEKGIWGRIKSFTKPNVVAGFFRFISDLVLPVSLSCRMFGNLLSGLVIMELIYYALGPFVIGVGAALAIFFNLFHVLMQAYVFLMLTFSFIHEATE
jgi:F-type H+-transporting ATPase subunit a